MNAGRLLAALALGLVLGGGPAVSEPATPIRVGYFPNLTHAQALLGRSTGRFDRALAPDATIEWVRFNAGPSVIEALFANRIDLAYVGPGPTVTGYVRSRGKALRVIAGSADGGAGLVVRRGGGIRRIEDLVSRRVATPQLGNTQDIALRHALRSAGLAPREQGGKVIVLPMANPDIRTLFLKGDLDAAWVPEPWVSLLIGQADGELLLDERTLWPDGRFVTANLVASTRFLAEHRDLALRFVAAHSVLTDWMVGHPGAAKRDVNEALRRETGKPMEEAILEAAWGRVRFTSDPLRASLEEGARRAYELGFLGGRPPDLRELYDLTLLDRVKGGGGR